MPCIFLTANFLTDSDSVPAALVITEHAVFAVTVAHLGTPGLFRTSGVVAVAS